MAQRNILHPDPGKYLDEGAKAALEADCTSGRFDAMHGGLEGALTRGVLPARFFRPDPKNYYRIKQLLPARKDQRMVVFNESLAGEDTTRPILAFALREDKYGRTSIVPAVGLTEVDRDQHELDGDEDHGEQENIQLVDDVAVFGRRLDGYDEEAVGAPVHRSPRPRASPVGHGARHNRRARAPPR